MPLEEKELEDYILKNDAEKIENKKYFFFILLYILETAQSIKNVLNIVKWYDTCVKYKEHK